MRRRVATIALAAATFAAGVGAVAYVRAADEPSGYVGKGQLVVRTSIGGSDTITIGGDVAMEERGTRIRIDVLSLSIPGTSVTISTLLATQLFPPGGFTIVYDRKDSSFTIWSTSKQRYYTSSTGAPQSASAVPFGGGGAGGSDSDLFAIFAFARTLRNDNAFNVSLGLAGHQVVNGHMATGLNFSYQRTTRTNETTDLHGTLQFADDLDGVPVEITVAGKTKSIPESAFRLDFSQLVKQTPSESDFEPPAGFARVSSIGDVVGKQLPIPLGQ